MKSIISSIMLLSPTGFYAFRRSQFDYYKTNTENAYNYDKLRGELGIKQQEFMRERNKQAFEQLGAIEEEIKSQLIRLQEEVEALEDPAKKTEKILEIQNLQQQLANIQQQKFSLYQSGLMGMNNYTGQSRQGGGQEYTQVNSRVRGYSDLINKYAQEFGVDPDLITAIMQVESAGNPNAVSGEGARGLMQFMPDTAANIARNLGIKEYDLHDPETSIKFGAALLKELQNRYKGNLEGILGDYNGGPKGANPKTRVPETQNYIPKVLSILNALKAERQAAQQQQVQQIVPLPNVQQTQHGAVAPALNTRQPEKEPTTTSENNVNQKPTELVETPVMTIGGVTYSRMEDPNERKRYTKLYNPKTREEISWEQLEDAVNSDKYGGDIEKLKADLAEEGFVDINKNPINMGFSYQNPTVNNGTPKTIWPGGVAPYSSTDPLSVDAMSSAQPPAPAGNIPNTPNIDANEAYGNIPFFDTPNPLFETGHIPYQVHTDNFMTSDMPEYNGDDPLEINPDVQTWLNRTSKTYTQPPLPIELSKYLTLPYWINGKKAIDGFHSRFRRR